MIETVSLVLLVAGASAAVGVLIGRYYVPDDRGLRRSAGHGALYLAALNRLLARDPKGAIDKLRAVVEDDVSDIQPYFALAALFRSRGEWERSIRLHQAIELRARRDEDKRQALYELGLDFRAAGMPRRATAALEDCVRSDPGHRNALRALAGLYEEQGRFAEAAEAWQRLLRIEGRAPSQRLMHLYAASAQREIEAGDLRSARNFIGLALDVDGESAHAHAVAGRLALEDGDPDEGRRHLELAITKEPTLAASLFGELAAAYGDEQGKGKAAKFLHELAADIDEPTQLLRTLIDLGDDVPEELRTELKPRLDALADEDVVAAILAGREALAGGKSNVVFSALRRLVQPEGALGRVAEQSWHCSHCFASRAEFFWRCQTCRHWGTATRYGSLLAQPTAGRERRQFARSARAAASLPRRRGDKSSTGAIRGWWSRLRS